MSPDWKDLNDSVNSMAGNLNGQVRKSRTSLRRWPMADLSKKITVDVKGEILELKNTINTMVDQLSSFASESPACERSGVRRPVRRSGTSDGCRRYLKDLTDM